MIRYWDQGFQLMGLGGFFFSLFVKLRERLRPKKKILREKLEA